MRAALFLGFLFAASAFSAELKLVMLDGKAEGQNIIMTRFDTVMVTKKIIEMVNGQAVVREVTETVPVQVQYTIKLDADAGDYLDPAGKAIDPKQVPELLKKPGVLAISTDGKPIDAAALKRIDKLVAVLVPRKGAKPKKAPPVEKKKPDGDEPFVATIQAQGGKLVITKEVEFIEQKVVYEERKGPDGMVVALARIVMVPVPKEVTTNLDPEAIEVQLRDGKKVVEDQLPKLLKTKTTVIVSPNGEPISYEFLKAHPDLEFLVLIKPTK
jgi:hypothetical protein